MSSEELNPEHQKLWRLERWAGALSVAIAAIPVGLYVLGHIERTSAIRFAIISMLPMLGLRICIALKLGEVWNAGHLIRSAERPVLFFLVVGTAVLMLCFFLFFSVTIDQWPR